MDQVALKALEVDPMQLMVIGIGLLAIAIVLLAYFNSRATNNLVGVMQSQVNSNGRMTENQGKQTDILRDFRDELRQEREQRETHAGITRQLKETVEQHDEKSAGYVAKLDTNAEERHKYLIDRINTNMSDLIGETGKIVDKSTKQIIEVVQPMLPVLGMIRESIEEAQKEYIAKMESLGEQVAAAQRQIMQVIDTATAKGEEREQIREQNVVVNVDGAGNPGVGVSAGDSSGSTGANGTGHSVGTDGINGGTTA